MKKDRVYYYPTQVLNKSDSVRNPYTDNFKDGLSNFCDVVDQNSTANVPIINLLKNIFKIDSIIFNWIENIGLGKAGILQFILFVMSLIILKIRRVKIVWILHNIHPHQGKKKIVDYTKKLMFKYSDLIITHSKQAEEYAKAKTFKRILFFHHPVDSNLLTIDSNDNRENSKTYDFLIWGLVEPYKGILEFLQYTIKNNKKWKIKIIGKCKNEKYKARISSCLSESITFENRMISFSELSELIQMSKFVLFPYKSTSISSSGTLMDTLALKGNIIGPSKGAFKDLADENICHTFKEYSDISKILDDQLDINYELITNFISNNSWGSFSKRVTSEIKLLNEIKH